MTEKNKRTGWFLRFIRKAGIWTLSAIFALASGFGPMDAYAADADNAIADKLERIRVALFIDSDKYKNTAPQITLSSEQGFRLGLKKQNEVYPMLAWDPGQSARFSLDQPMIRWFETEDLGEAQTAVGKLADLRQQGHIFRQTANGRQVYEVFSGPYPSAAAAESALEKLQQAVREAAEGKADPRLVGPHYVSAGTYVSESEALRRLAAVREAGVAANLAYVTQENGTTAYAVWIGGAENEEELAMLQKQAEALLPQTPMNMPDPNASYLLLREAVVKAEDGGTAAIGHYFFQTEHPLWISPLNPEAGLKVAERNGRTFRGNVELGKLRDHLAVINEVDFEQYLYSVVSAEMGKGWPAEAQKAQAVAARTFALKQGMKYGIAHVSDSVADQAYYGMDAEVPESIEAVKATEGLVLAGSEGLIEPLFSANAGGQTADPSEVFGYPAPYLKSVPSPDSQPAENRPLWHRVMLPDGRTGYVTSDYLRETGEINEAGLPYVEPTAARVNVRPAPKADNQTSPPIAQVNPGDRLLSLEQVPESNAYSWVAGPYDPDTLLRMINEGAGNRIEGPLHSLEITKRGPSGRVTEMKANGQTIEVEYPDALRRVFGGLPSTKFEIVATGGYTILGADGSVRTVSREDPVYAVTANNADAPAPLQNGPLILNGKGQAREVTAGLQFTFRGTGNGHGLGMSQWGAKSLAESGYDFRQILQHYYAGINIVKVE